MVTEAARETAVAIIDDEESMREGCRQTLAEEGYRTAVAADGEEGLRLVAQTRPNVVLVDLKMPGISGMEVLWRIRQIDPGIVTIVITGYGTIASAVEAMRAGASDYLTKPFGDDRLLSAVAHGLRREPVARLPSVLEREEELAVDTLTIPAPWEIAPPVPAPAEVVEEVPAPEVEAVAAPAVEAVPYAPPRIWPLAVRPLALAVAACAVLAAIGLARYVPGPLLRWDWLRLTSALTLTVELAVTPLGMIVVVGGAVCTLLITLYSMRAMAGQHWEGRFYAYTIATLAGVGVVGLAGNLLVLLVGWEIVTLMMFLMINQGKGDAKAGGAKAYGMLGFADACLLMAIVLLATCEGGAANLSLRRGPISVGSLGPMGHVVYVLIMVAALAKAGAIPLHTWVPSIAQHAPVPVMAFLPAALDKLLGIYLLAVLSLRMFRPDGTMQVVMMVLGGVTIIAAVLMAMMQHNLKRLLSFHAVSQVGYMVLGIGTGTTVGVIGGLFHMINNAIYKCNLFLMSGSVSRAAGTDDLEDMGGLAKALPVTFACGLIAALAISGVPPLNGFVSKWLVYQGALELGHPSAGHGGLAIALLVVAVFGSALTLASFVKVMYSAFLSPAPKGSAAAAGTVRESFWLAAPMVILAAACIVLGIWPQLATEHVLKPAIAGTATAGEGLAAATGGLATGQLGLWNPAGAATGLILIGIVGGLLAVWITKRRPRVRVVRPFLGGEVPDDHDDRFRVPGTHFYQTIRKLPIFGSLLTQGEGGAMDPYYWSAKHGHTFVEFLRSLHTGLLSLYVVWVLVGVAVALMYVLLNAGI